MSAPMVLDSAMNGVASKLKAVLRAKAERAVEGLWNAPTPSNHAYMTRLKWKFPSSRPGMAIFPVRRADESFILHY